jgi:hypothetical protein
MKTPCFAECDDGVVRRLPALLAIVAVASATSAAVVRIRGGAIRDNGGLNVWAWAGTRGAPTNS